MRGKRVQFDDETWQALDLLSRDQMKDFQELADEAFRDLRMAGSNSASASRFTVTCTSRINMRQDYSG